MKKIYIIFVFIFTIILIYSVYNIIIWIKDGNKTKEIINEIDELVEIVEIETTDEIDEIENNTETEEQKEEYSIYKEYEKIKMIDVNFDKLYKINTETKGWLNVPNTNINYPFVQKNDNSYYLTHAFDNSKNIGGWVFLDYRNNIDSLNKNTIMGNGTMFGSLKNCLKSNWLSNTDNHFIRISTKNSNMLFKVFSLYSIETTSDYIQTNFKDNEEFMNFIKLIKDRSVYKFDTQVNENDYILTLSTCNGKNLKLVMHAKLIKKEQKL